MTCVALCAGIRRACGGSAMAGQANQHGCVVQIVVGHVVNIRVCGEQFGAVVEVNANHK
jgi:hypothetical protein